MRSGAASVDELLAHGGWMIDDAQARHAANPTSFLLPQPETLARVVPGTMVRAIFMVLDQADPVIDQVDAYDEHDHPNLVVSHEPLWLWVLSVEGSAAEGEILGVVADLPKASFTRLMPGAEVRVPLAQVIDVDLAPKSPMESELQAQLDLGFERHSVEEVLAPEDPTRMPSLPPAMAKVAADHGVLPQRPYPAPTVRLLVGKTLKAGVRPIFGGRLQPNAERGDCGWTIWATHPDLGHAGEIDGFEPLSVTDLPDRCPEAWPFLALPPGWAFVLGPDGHIEVYQSEELA